MPGREPCWRRGPHLGQASPLLLCPGHAVSELILTDTAQVGLTGLRLTIKILRRLFLCFSIELSVFLLIGVWV